jgi:hypothetical protein
MINFKCETKRPPTAFYIAEQRPGRNDYEKTIMPASDYFQGKAAEKGR